MRYVRDVDRYQHEPISAAHDGSLAAKRRRTARWLVLALVLVLVPMLMVLVGYVIG